MTQFRARHGGLGACQPAQRFHSEKYRSGGVASPDCHGTARWNRDRWGADQVSSSAPRRFRTDRTAPTWGPVKSSRMSTSRLSNAG